MFRRMIVVGDAPLAGGRVLPYQGPKNTVMGHQVALIGGRAWCDGCNSVGIIARAGGPYRVGFYEAKIALEGDVVVCQCKVPPPLVSSLQSISRVDDRRGFTEEFQPAALPEGWYLPDMPSLTMSKKVVDGFVKHPPEAEQTENICPNMTNAEFVKLLLQLRDRAVALIGKRLNDLEKWGPLGRQRVVTWFGRNDEEARQYLRNGYQKTSEILEKLTGINFIRYSAEFGRNVGCVADTRPEVAAGVCKPDSGSRTIAVTNLFCSLRDYSAGRDSKLSTLIHEVTHFTDTFDSLDIEGNFEKCIALARRDSTAAMKNADNFSGYVVWDEVYDS